MGAYKHLLYQYADGVGILTINRPEVRNALSRALLTELYTALEIIKRQDFVRVLIITGAGDRAFAAGTDITELKSLSPIDAQNFALTGQRVCSMLESIPQPVIAAVNGFALGGGCELAMACDIRIASHNAHFGQPEVSLGIIPGFGGTKRLPELVGKGRAIELLLTADSISAEEALRIGLINKVVPAELLLETAMALAQKIILCPPAAVRLCKATVKRGFETDLQASLTDEAEVFSQCFPIINKSR